MNIQLIFNNRDHVLTIPQEVLPVSGKPYPHHFTGTPIENLIELSGRVCYDSAQNEKSRNSIDYHKHIKDVGHYSVLEHANIVFLINKSIESLSVLMNRPGVYTYHNIENNNQLRVNINFRSILDWDSHTQFDSPESDCIKSWLLNKCCLLAPNIFDNNVVYDESLSDQLGLKLILPDTISEIWVSFYLGDVSRNCIYELIRHGDYTAISQRSTRYVDEDNSPWIWNPVYNKYLEENPSDNIMLDKEQLISDARNIYRNECNKIENWLINKGVNKFTARKTSRGSARGSLGSCLSTELIFSCTLWELKHIIKLRSNNGADSEIRLLTNSMLDEVERKFPSILGSYNKILCEDQLGYEIEFK